jgi:hypothetical protein
MRDDCKPQVYTLTASKTKDMVTEGRKKIFNQQQQQVAHDQVVLKNPAGKSY